MINVKHSRELFSEIVRSYADDYTFAKQELGSGPNYYGTVSTAADVHTRRSVVYLEMDKGGHADFAYWEGAVDLMRSLIRSSPAQLV